MSFNRIFHFFGFYQGCVKISKLLDCKNALAAFSFDHVGAKEKAFKKKSAIRKISRSAEREKGYSPSTPQTFEKV